MYYTLKLYIYIYIHIIFRWCLLHRVFQVPPATGSARKGIHVYVYTYIYIYIYICMLCIYVYTCVIL